MAEPRAVFRDLPAAAFPFHVVAYDADTGEPLHWHAVHGPGAMKIPGKPEGVREVKVYMRYSDGLVIDQ